MAIEESDKEMSSPTQEQSQPSGFVSDALMTELVALRKKRKIGQKGIADAIGISQGRVSQMENLKGGVTLDAVLMYAQAIGANIIVVPDKKTRKKSPPS